MWEYRDYDTQPLPQRYPYERVTVTGQTTLAGRDYFRVVTQRFRPWYGQTWDVQRSEALVRFDTSAAMVRRAVNGGADEDDVLLCRLDLPVPDSSAFVPCGDNEFPTYSVVPDAAIQIGTDLVETTIRSERYLYFTQRFAAGIGYVGVEGCEISCADVRLEYVRVGGVTYGVPVPGLPAFSIAGPDPTPAEAYAPLAVGNRWEYRLRDLNSNATQGYRRETVLRDTLVDGWTWGVRLTETFSAGLMLTSATERLVRFDAAEANVRERSLASGPESLVYPCPLNLDLTDDDFLPCSVGVTYDKRPATVLGAETTRLEFGYDFGSTAVAAGFGFVSQVEEGILTELIFARIDGQTFGTPVAGEADAALAAAFSLAAAPNPTAGALTLVLTLPAAQTVAVEAFDVLGRRVWQQSAALAASPQSVAVDASAWAPGVYVVRATAGRVAATARVVRR